MERATVKKVIGPVVDIHFPDGQLPELFQAIEINLPKGCYIVKVGKVVRKISIR